MKIRKDRRPDLSAEAERFLRELSIDENGPGTVVKDFRMLLDFVKEGDVPVTKAQQLPIAPLPAINARMTHPLSMGLKRAVQKSYPHINGLYLLLRASGLTTVEARGRKLLLRLDPVVLSSFQELNDTEQYCTLLETWLLRGWPDIVLEGGRRYSPIPRTFQEWSHLFRQIPETGMACSENPTFDYLIRYHFTWTNLALLELFGLVTIVTGPPIDGAGWRIERLRRAPLGDVLLRLLNGEFFKGSHPYEDFRNENMAKRVGAMQPAIQPFFPQWKNNISIPPMVFREGVHIFRVSLGRVWFRIGMPASDFMDGLASMILGAVHFDSDHLYMFTYRNRFGSLEVVNHYYVEDPPWANEVRIGELELPVGQPMTFLFDFGDEWEFEVVLERVETDRNIQKPELLEMHGEPPEQYPRWEE